MVASLRMFLISYVVIVVTFARRNLLTHSVLRNFLVSFGVMDNSLYFCIQKYLNEKKYDNS